MQERTKALLIAAAFASCWFLPVGDPRFDEAVIGGLSLVKWYAREHVLWCLVPAFLIAGAISVFVSQGAVMRYLGPHARKLVAYPVAAASGTILAVCSCTVLPLFASIHKRGAGLGPATAFLYSGPAINVLAIILTARVLGPELGIARAIGAIVFAVVIGLLMQLVFRREEADRAEGGDLALPVADRRRRPWQNVLYFGAMLGVLVFANWGAPAAGSGAIWVALFDLKWLLTAGFAGALVVIAARWFERDELRDWGDSSWFYAKQILPLLLVGVFTAGILLGGPTTGHGVIPNHWVERMVGGDSLGANLFASVAGAFMYFATLTEIPILEGLLASGMGKGPALALLLAGPALSLPSMLVIRSVLGTKKTLVYIGLVVVMSTTAGFVYGTWFALA